MVEKSRSSELLLKAISLHQAGNLNEAETLYRTILSSDPKHFDALTLLGTVHLQRGHREEGVRLIGLSLEINPKQPVALNNRGNALIDLKLPAEALASFDQAIALNPGFADAYNNRGNALNSLKRPEDALASYNKAIALNPGFAEAYNNRSNTLSSLKRPVEAFASSDQAIARNPGFAEAYNSRGNALNSLKRPEDALASYNKAIALNPGFAEAHYNRGNALVVLKRPTEALPSFDQAIELKPGYAEAFNNRGNALVDLQRPTDALPSFDQAIALNPDFAEAHYNRGNALQDLQRPDEALASYDRALALRPDYVEAHYNRGVALQKMNRLDEALASYDRALALRPDYVEAHYNRGIVLQDLQRPDEALASYDRALALRPDYVEAHYNRGVALQKMNRLDEALATYDRALALNPDYPYLPGIWLHSKMHCCDWDNLDAAYTKITNAIGLGKKVSPPFAILAIPASPAQQRHCAEIFIHDKYPSSPASIWQGARYEHDRIRIGYFSGNFRNHATAHLMAELFERHDRSRFEITGFSLGPTTHDTWRQRLEKAFDRFIDVNTQSDREIAMLARKWEIDIALDLMGHTQFGRIGIFAHRPAPVQVNYLGYPGTIGADYIDYLIADHTLIPAEHRPHYSEKIVYFPHSYLVNDSTKKIADRAFSRAELCLPDNAFVFCCFNNNFKLTPDLFDIWMRLLKAVPDSVLWLLEGNTRVARNLRHEAEVRGVSPDRLVFAPVMELADHLARHRQADLFLDTLYCNAHTTASDALWAGLPVLTCPSNTFAGRVAASLLAAIGLLELIAHSPTEYENLAYDLATHPERLAVLRRKLAENRNTHPLFDTARITRNFETAYLRMYERSQAGLPPDHIAVEA